MPAQKKPVHKKELTPAQKKPVHKKKLTPAQRKKRRRKAIFNRIIFGTVCLALLALIIYLIYTLITFISSSLGNKEHPVISDQTESYNENQVFYPDDEFNPYDGIIICLDAGHGGEDTGAVDLEGNTESSQNLELTLLVKEELERIGIKVLMTRTTDQYIGLSERCDIANNAGASLLLSIHRNSYAADSSISGVEAWINSSCPETDYDIAETILEALTKIESTESRGVKHGTRDDGTEEDYAINDVSNMPSLILEMGYMSSPEDNRLFREHLREYSRAIANSIANWYLNN